MPPIKRFWPILLVAALFALAFATGLNRELTWDAFVAHRQQIADAVARDPARAALAYVAIYVLVVAASVPGAVWLTVAGGFLFGTRLGTLLAVLGATTGATLLFLAARTSFGAGLRARDGSLFERIRPGLERHGFIYLMALRIMPVFPFWLVNLAPAILGIRLTSYVAATALGIIPVTAIFASIGAGLGDVLSQGGAPDLGIIFTRPVLLPLAGLALLALLPVAYVLAVKANSKTPPENPL